MTINYTFCKKDGNIKKYYIPVCQYIIEAKTQKHEIMVGRYSDIVDSYSCYTTPRRDFCAKDRRLYVTKIQEICSCFNVTTREWYSGNELSVELHGEGILTMFLEIKNLLGGVNHTR